MSIISTLAWGLGYFGMPHILLRFMAIEDEKKLVLSRRIASVWVVIAMTASIVIGIGGRRTGSASRSASCGRTPAGCSGIRWRPLGGLMVFVWKYIISPLGGVFSIYELLPAFLFSALVIVVVSLLTQKPNADMDSEFDRVKAGEV